MPTFTKLRSTESDYNPQIFKHKAKEIAKLLLTFIR